MDSCLTMDRLWSDSFFNSSIVIQKQADSGGSEGLTIQSCPDKPGRRDVRLSPFSAN